MGEEVISVRANFHTHNYRCGHAEGDVEDYVKEAIKEGYAEIDFQYTDECIISDFENNEIEFTKDGKIFNS